MSDLDRLRNEYARRARQLAGDDRYSLTNKSNLFLIQNRQRDVVSMLERHHLLPLDGKRALELGCGAGGVLSEWLGYGISPKNLHGLDMLPDRIEAACFRLPDIPLSIANGQNLPYSDHSFDIVLQFTMLSSILDDQIRRQLAGEMVRVVKPDGAIISYDFWLNPTNAHTKGVHPRNLRALFPGCQIKAKRITLAQPITRRLVPVSWTLVAILEKLRFLNTHFLAVIRPIDP